MQAATRILARVRVRSSCPPGKIRDVVDVLDSLLALPVGSAGALRFQSDWPVAILCRTSNVDPSGVRPGTFGAQQRPVPLLSFVTSADAGRVDHGDPAGCGLPDERRLRGGRATAHSTR